MKADVCDIINGDDKKDSYKTLTTRTSIATLKNTTYVRAIPTAIHGYCTCVVTMIILKIWIKSFHGFLPLALYFWYGFIKWYLIFVRIISSSFGSLRDLPLRVSLVALSVVSVRELPCSPSPLLVSVKSSIIGCSVSRSKTSEFCKCSPLSSRTSSKIGSEETL